VLEDDRGSDPFDLGPADQPFQHEAAQVVGVGDGDVQEEVVIAGDVEERSGLRQGHDLAGKPFDLVALGMAIANGDERLQGLAQPREVDARVIADDDAALLEAADASKAARLREVDPGCQLLVREPCILLQGGQNLAIDCVKMCGRPLWPEFYAVIFPHQQCRFYNLAMKSRSVRPLDASAPIARVAEARAALIAAAADLTGDQERYRPGPQEWSVSEVVEHLWLAEQAGVNRIWQAAIDLRRGQPVWSGDRVHRGLSIEEVIEATWRVTSRGPISIRTSENSPDTAVPRTGGPLAYWIACLQAGQLVLEKLAHVLEGLKLTEVIVPHVVSGPLDAQQRLQFFHWHFDHHRQQIEDIKAAPGFPLPRRQEPEETAGDLEGERSPIPPARRG
jgi:hypothetical protein